MSLENFLNKLNQGDSVEFDEVIDIIKEFYQYIPAKFTNGLADDLVVNEAGENEGSCKIFSFAKLNNLSKEETLNCFGKYYYEDVLNNPEGTDHSNIRAFMKHGWSGVSFETNALVNL